MTFFEFYMCWLRWFLYGDFSLTLEFYEDGGLEMETPDELTLTGFIGAPFSAK